MKQFKKNPWFTIVLIVACFYLFLAIHCYFTKEEKQITVKKTFNSPGKYGHLLITTTDNEIYKISNNVFLGILNSSEIFGNIKHNSTYNVTVCGFKKLNHLGIYPQILKISQV
tara:strand:+ start:402 stop:740 length:339 start_codon:yes stop_codon:yes gene_type:complete